MASQDQAVRNKNIKARLIRPKKTVNHVLSEYSKLDQKEYKIQHD